MKNNFHNLFKGDNACPFKCTNKIDSQEHILKCDKIILHLDKTQQESLDNVKYEDLFGNFNEQFNVTKVFQALIKVREGLLERDQGPACLGKNSGPCG